MPSQSTSAHQNLTRGYVIALIGTLFLSTTAILIRYLTQTYQIPALVLAFWRDLFVAVTLLFALGILKPRLLSVDRRHIPYLVIYGFMLALFNALWTLSVALNGAAVATVLVYSSAGFTALLGWWLLKERLGWVKLLAVACSLGGCALVSGATQSASWSANLMGILTGILAGLLYAIYSIMGRSASQRGLNPWSTLIYIFAFAAGFLLVINLLPIGLPGKALRPVDLFWLGDALAGWGVLFLLSAVPTIGGFGLYMVSLGYLPSSVANLIATLEPTFTAVTAFFLLGERMNVWQIGGSLMILAGVVFLRIYDGWIERRSAALAEAEPL
jgi:drug/metabolite transporter (DMT)-like permease